MKPFFNPYNPQFQSNGPNPPQQGNKANMLQGPMQPPNQNGTIPSSCKTDPMIPPGFGNQIPATPSSINVSPMMMNPQGFGNPMGSSTGGQFGNFQPQMPMMPNYGNFPQNNMGMPPNGQYLNQLLALQAQITMQIQNHAGAQQIQNHAGVQQIQNHAGAQQAMGCPNPAFFGNPQFGQPRGNQNMQNMRPNGMSANGWNPRPMGNQQVQGQPGAHPRMQNPNVQNNGPPGSQSMPMKDAQMNIPNSNWKNSPGNNFNNNPKGGPSKWGFQKGQNHNAANGKGKFGFPNGNKKQGRRKEKAPQIDFATWTEEPTENKRSVVLTYTEKEVQQWREERKNNFPSTVNIEKKQIESQRNSEAIQRKANARREQLKEILAKQAELGVEVAEIPSHYLSESNTRADGREDNRRQRNKKSGWQNKNDRKRKNGKNNRFNKKQRLEDGNGTPNASYNQRKPTLLEKLLSADIKRDKSRLRQVFRFMVMNSFFKDYPDKPLEFPLVSVKENESKENSTPIKHDFAENYLDDTKDDDDDNSPDGAGKGNSHKTESPEEEGEITD
ncbi:hypothetical protein ACFE04_009960 [Oxalis oulophora]